jgi:hypothetical protein
MCTRKALRLVIGAAITLLLSGSALASGLGVAAFLAPGKAVDKDVMDAAVSAGAFKARLSIPAVAGFRQAIGFGYSYYLVTRYPPGYVWAIYTLSKDTAVISVTYGWDFERRFGPVKPFVGGGGVLAVEVWDSPFTPETEKDVVPGVYVNAGVEYRLGGWALEAGPRYTVLFNEPVAAVDLNGHSPEVRAAHRSQYVDVLVGFGYYF